MDLREASDDELLAELTLRGRIKTIEAHQIFFNVLVDDEDTGYIDGVERDIVRLLGAEINNELAVTWHDMPVSNPVGGFSQRTLRRGLVHVIAPVKTA